MKVGIVTITELDNFGNRLQNYALQEVLSRNGIQVETIPNYIVYEYRKKKIYKIKQVIKGVLKLNRGRIAFLVKQIRFEKYDSKYFSFSKGHSTIDYISPELKNMYDYVIAGSDQIWNSYFNFNFEFNFLTFVERNKRIAYAASFGTDDVKLEKREQFGEWLNGIDRISVREYKGREIIEDLTGKKAQVVLDPSMLLTKEEWIEVEKKPKWMESDYKYILLYFLGSTEDLNNILNKLYEENREYKNYKIINIHDWSKIKEFSITPDEFLWLIGHSQLMITDSFHGTVFSILLEIPFIHSLRRKGYVEINSRIESLYKILEIDDTEFIKNKHINSSRVKDILHKKRKEAYDFLGKSLHCDEFR